MPYEELWVAEDGVERFSLDSDGCLYSDHVSCGVQLSASQLRSLGQAAFAAAEALGDDESRPQQ